MSSINEIVGSGPDGLTLHDGYAARLVACPRPDCLQRPGGNCNGGTPHPERVLLGLVEDHRRRSLDDEEEGW